MMQVIRLVQGAGFSMSQSAIEAVHRQDLIQNLHSMDEVRAAVRPLHVIPASGTWNFLPYGEGRGALVMLDEAHKVYGSFDGITIVFDCAGEGFGFQPAVHRALVERLRRYAIPPERAVMLTSRLEPQAAYDAWCRANGEPIVLTMLSTPVQLYFYAGAYLKAMDEAYMRRRIAERWPPAEPLRPKKFLCLNNMPREARWTTVASLLDAGVLDDGHVSFHGFDAYRAAGEQIPTIEMIQSEQRSLGVPEAVIARIPEVLDRSPMLLPEPPASRFNMAYDVADQPYWGEVYFSILTESDFPGHAGARFTEKVLKPIANLLPFVLIAPPGVLKELKRIGFETFDGLIDESYDEVEDTGLRLNAAIAEAVRLARMSRVELRELYIRAWPRLTHNFTHFLSLTPTLCGMDPAFAALSAEAPPPPPAWRPLGAAWTYRTAPETFGAAPWTMRVPEGAWEYGHFSVVLPETAEPGLIRVDIEPGEGEVGVSLMSADGSSLLTEEIPFKAGGERRVLHFERLPGVKQRILFRNLDLQGRSGHAVMHAVEEGPMEEAAPFTAIFRQGRA